MTDIVERLCAPVSDDDDYMIGQWPGEPPKKYDALRLEAADEIKRLRAEVETWVGHAKTAIWSDSEECKLLTADNERLRAALREIVRLDNEWFPESQDDYTYTGYQVCADVARAVLNIVDLDSVLAPPKKDSWE